MNQTQPIQPAHQRPWRLWVAFCVFALIAAFFMLTGHSAHVFGAVPYLLILACPLMHLFMHHGGHDSAQTRRPGTPQT